MAIVGNISGSSSQSYQIGLTGSVIIGRPAQNEKELPGIGSDVVLFVSGSPGGRGVSSDSAAKRKSTAVIGGDLLASGNVFFVSKETGAHVTNPSLVFSKVGSDVVFFVSGNQGGIDNNRGVSLIGGDLVVSGGAVFEAGRTGDGDFIVNSKNYLHRFKVDSNNGRVIVGQYGDQGALADGPHADTLFFVSGSRGAKDGNSGRIATFGGDLVVSGNTYIIPRGKHEKDSAVMSNIGSDVVFFVSGAGDSEAGGTGKDHTGTSVFGGDLVVSGVIYGGVDTEASTTLLELNAGLNIISSQAGSEKVEAGSDVILFVSGSPEARASSIRGVSVIGGDLFVSGNSYFVPGGSHEEDTVAFSKVGTNVHFFVSGVNGVDLQDENTGLGGFGAILLGGDTIISGALVIGPSDNDGGSDWQVDFGTPEYSGSGIKFIVSGAVGLQGTGESQGQGEATSVFVGDTVISGSLIVGEGRGVDGANDWYGGTISGSIHHTEDGISYLAAGANITITSGSDGQITIASTGGGSGDVDVSGTPADNQIAIWTDADTLEGTSTLTYDGTTIGLNDAVTINEGGADNDFRAETNNKTHALFLDGGTDQVLLAAGGAVIIGTDTGLFISGSLGGKGTIAGHGAKGTAVIGGDLVTSGTAYIAVDGVDLQDLDKQTLIVGATSITGSDVGIFFSGSMGQTGGGHTYGTSLFGGDLVVSGGVRIHGADTHGTISGSVHVTDTGISYLRAGNNITIVSASNGQVTITASGGSGDVSAGGTPSNNQIAIWTAADEIEGVAALTYDGTTISLNDAVTINEGGADNDFRVETNNKTHALFLDGETDQVLLGAGAAVTIGTDAGLFISGAIGGRGTIAGHGAKGSVVVGGDLVTSGTAYIAVDGVDLQDLDKQTLIVGATSITGSDISMFFSGSRGQRGTPHSYGTALFGGDTFVSGAIYANSVYSGDDLHVTDDVTVGGDLYVVEYIKHTGDTDTYIRFQEDDINVQAGGVDFIKITEDESQDLIEFNVGEADVDFIVNNDTDEVLRIDTTGIVFNEDGHANIDFRVETVRRRHALFVDGGTDQVLVGVSSITGSDVSFFVSGGFGTGANSSYKQVSLFGGDLVTSGGMTVFGSDTFGSISGSIHETAEGISYLRAGNNITIVSASNGQVTITASGGSGDVSAGGTPEDNQIAIWSDSDTVEGTNSLTYDGTTINLNDAVTINEGGADNDFRVETNNLTHALFVDGGTDQVLLKAGSTITIGTDAGLFVSGSVGGRGTIAGHGAKGTSVFEGDLLISGTAYLGMADSQIRDLSIPLLMVGETDITGSDVAIFFSGSIGRRAHPQSYGTTVFGGDTFVSGAFYASDINIADDLSVTDDAGIGGDLFVAEYIKHTGDTDTYIRFQEDDINIQAGGVDFIKITEDDSQDLIEFNVGEADVDFIVNNTNDEALRIDTTGVVFNEDGHATNDFRIESDNNTHAIFVDAGNNQVLVGTNTITGSDVVFFVSGGLGSSIGSPSHRGTSLFGGDLVVSGGMKVFGSDLYQFGSISGSIHVTDTGISFLRAGSNVTIVSASNGQVTIGMDEAGVTTSGTPADNQIAIFTDSDTVEGNSALTYNGSLISLNDAVTINDGAADNDFRVEGGSGRQGMILVDAGTNQVGILTDGTAASNAYGLNASTNPIPGDVSLFISGANSMHESGATAGLGYSGVTLIGGDLVVSGVLAGPYDYGERALTVSSKVGIFAHNDQYASPGSDPRLWVSGVIGGKYWGVRTAACFGGDVVMSGALFVGLGTGQGDPRKALYGVGSDVITFHSGALGGRNSSYPGGVHLFGGTLVTSGALLVGIDEDEDSGTDAVLYVSGALGHRYWGGSRNAAVFNADVVISGSTLIGVDHNEEAGTDAVLYVSGALGLRAWGYETPNVAVFNSDLVCSGVAMFNLGAESEGHDVSKHTANIGSDVGFYVSGGISSSTSGKDKQYTKSVAAFGGDVVISGTLYGGYDSEYHQDMLTIETNLVLIEGRANAPYLTSGDGDDCLLFVSGTQGGKDSIDNSVSCFGGDVVLSGTLHVEQGEYGAVFAKTQHSAHDLASGAADTIDGRAGTITITVNGTIANGSPIGMITFTNSDIKATDAIVASTSEAGILVYASGVEAGEFNLRFTNNTGGNVNNDSTFIVNWVAL